MDGVTTTPPEVLTRGLDVPLRVFKFPVATFVGDEDWLVFPVRAFLGLKLATPLTFCAANLKRDGESRVAIVEVWREVSPEVTVSQPWAFAGPGVCSSLYCCSHLVAHANDGPSALHRIVHSSCCHD